MPIHGSLGGSSSFSFGKIMSSVRKSFLVQYVVVAGGGGGGGGTNAAVGGGGAGGYRCNVSGENSGGGSSAEPQFSIFSSSAYRVTVGAGGAASQTGSNSIFSSITSSGGGFGGFPTGGSGGSGGGGGWTGVGDGIGQGGLGISGQGFLGGNGRTNANNTQGGGGGAGEAGSSWDGVTPGRGGNGVSSAITGSSVPRGGGGGGGADLIGGGGAGGTGGGGTGRSGAGGGGTGPTAGTVNTGGGGGGSAGITAGANGGSGLVIISYPISYTPTFSAGVTQTTSVVSGNRVSVVTATSTTSETVSFTQAPPSGYTLGANGKYYKYYSTAQSFSAAQATCNSEGGWLAVPLSSADNSAIRNAALSANPTSVWLGISDAVTEGTWRITSTGHPLSGQNAPYFNWNSGEPNNSGDEDYVEMYISGASTGLWNDANLVSNRVFVGEWYIQNPEIFSVVLPPDSSGNQFAYVGTPIIPSIYYFSQPAPTFSYQWQRSTFGSDPWTNISGATGSSYAPESAYLGIYIRVRVTITNTNGSTSLFSSNSLNVYGTVSPP